MFLLWDLKLIFQRAIFHSELLTCENKNGIEPKLQCETKEGALKDERWGPSAAIVESASMCRRSNDKEHLLVSQSFGGSWNMVGWWGLELLSEGEVYERHGCRGYFQ